MKNRILVMMLMLVLSMSLCACGKVENNVEKNANKYAGLAMENGHDFRNSNLGDSVDSVKKAETAELTKELDGSKISLLEPNQTVLYYALSIAGIDSKLAYDFHGGKLDNAVIYLQNVNNVESTYLELKKYYAEKTGKAVVEEDGGFYIEQDGKYLIVVKVSQEIQISVQYVMQ